QRQVLQREIGRRVVGGLNPGFKLGIMGGINNSGHGYSSTVETDENAQGTPLAAALPSSEAPADWCQITTETPMNQPKSDLRLLQQPDLHQVLDRLRERARPDTDRKALTHPRHLRDRRKVLVPGQPRLRENE